MPGQGVPINMTLLPEKLATAGYVSHFVGKWHIGMARRQASPPEARGFATSLGYFHSTNNYYNGLRAEGCANQPALDLWDSGRPASELDDYEERVFARHAVETIQRHDASMPFFMYYAFHSSCVGWDVNGHAGGESDSLQPDKAYFAAASFIDHPDRRANHAMVALMDDAVGNITAALKRKGMWAQTLLLWSSDNGGAVSITATERVTDGTIERSWKRRHQAHAHAPMSPLPTPHTHIYVHHVPHVYMDSHRRRYILAVVRTRIHCVAATTTTGRVASVQPHCWRVVLSRRQCVARFSGASFTRLIGITPSATLRACLRTTIAPPPLSHRCRRSTLLTCGT
uniref:Sulfatase N-terminal domain-containing protein n=2 Tax=Haptolina brevifila TaxID=156173 RepID=A0A6U7P1N7_9EUKA|mmetsp:Transcript_87107/g.174010  ORF Transcript_87107/g.174010 Transcript_87107/m.174010 type:complete len:341 (+) Transcript_87107:268-1290(+)